MSDPFVAEIRMFGGNFAPTGWAQCNGQLLPISQNTALFSLLGTVYGGDGKSTFALPNLQGASPVAPGQGAGLVVGRDRGRARVHTHTLRGNFNPADLFDPTPQRSLAKAGTGFLYQSDTSANLTAMAPQTLSVAGGSLPHNNMQPYLTVVFIIAMQGVFPARP